MDLGYGKKNQNIGDVLAEGILQTSKAQEAALNNEISKYDALLNANDSDLDFIRERRIAQMKKVQEQRQKWKSMGHGVYSAIGEGQHGSDAAKEFFDASRESERMVVHFHRPSTRSCDVFHAHLEKLAQKHLETRFVKIDVDTIGEDGASGSGAAYLVEKLGIVVMPTIVIVKNRKAAYHIRGFDELGGTEDFSIKALKWLIGVHGGINQAEGAEPPEELQGGRRGVNGVKIRSRYSGGKRGGVREEENEYDSDE
jgi:hypothetical protein